MGTFGVLGEVVEAVARELPCSLRCIASAAKRGKLLYKLAGKKEGAPVKCLKLYLHEIGEWSAERNERATERPGKSPGVAKT